MTFLPPATGLWRVMHDADITYPAGNALILGECEFRHNPRTSVLCRAGKRVWCHRVMSATSPKTFTLEAVPQVLTAVPAGGLLTASYLTDGQVFFGTITVPAAGTYRISNPAAANAALLLAVSPVDPYVADFRAGPYAILPGETRPVADPITLEFTADGPATVFVRFESWDPFFSSPIGSPAVGGASGQMTWAAV